MGIVFVYSCTSNVRINGYSFRIHMYIECMNGYSFRIHMYIECMNQWV